MSRPRKHDRHLPRCVFHRHGAFWYVKRGKWTRLGDNLQSALAKYARLVEAPTGNGAMVKLVDDAIVEIRKHVAPETARLYGSAAKKLKRYFDEMNPTDVTSRDVVVMRRDLAGTPNMANRCVSLLRQVFDYALEEQIVAANPCVGIKRLKEAVRERLITAQEFEAIYRAARPRMQCIMDLLFLTGQRVMDAVRIRQADIRDEGIYFRQQKTGARLLVKWSPGLRAVIDRARTMNKVVSSVYLFTRERGTRNTPPSLNTIEREWVAACAAAGVQDANLRDLRAMSGTEAKRQGLNPTALLGHTSPKMTERYLRAKEIPEVEGPVKKERIQNG